MTENIHLELVTPTRLVAKMEVSEVQAPGVEGEFGVLPGHTVFITLLRPGEVRFREGEHMRHFVVGRGFAEVGPDHVTILTDSAEETSTLNAGELRQILERDEARLKTLASDDPETALVFDRVERNRARLAAAERRL